jgi:hypothetical protein
MQQKLSRAAPAPGCRFPLAFAAPRTGFTKFDLRDYFAESRVPLPSSISIITRDCSISDGR